MATAVKAPPAGEREPNLCETCGDEWWPCACGPVRVSRPVTRVLGLGSQLVDALAEVRVPRETRELVRKLHAAIVEATS